MTGGKDEFEMTDIRSVQILLIGLGNVGRRFLELLVRKERTLQDRLGLEIVIVGAADTSGAAICACRPDTPGLDPKKIIQLKNDGKGVASYPDCGQPERKALDLVRTTEADVLLDASPANLNDGQPGLSCIETALSKGMHVVTANKAPLVLAFPRLRDLAREQGVRLTYDATVTGGLPAVNLGERDLAAATVHRLEGVLNLTTNYILTRMALDGLSYDEALADAQRAGHAEADPTLDVDGWDAASKLVILSHCVLHHPATFDDIDIEGIRQVTKESLDRAAAQGKVVKLVASAVLEDGRYAFHVRPTLLDATHPLAQLGPKQMGVVYHTDISGIISAAIVEETPVPTASAMLRDLVDIFAAPGRMG
jgi:homoserine dehydrogenase